MKPRTRPEAKSEKRPAGASKRAPDAGAIAPSTRRKLARIGEEIAELRSALEKVARQHSSARQPERGRK